MTLHQYIQNCKLDIKHTKKQQRMINILFSTIEQNRVNKIKSQSLEIEGIFKDNPPNYVGDGSVSVSADQDDEGNRIQNVLGESRSDICYNDNANVGNYVGWICVRGGNPGTWSKFGLIG